MRTQRRTHTHLTKLTVAFRRLSNASKYRYNKQIAESGHDLQSCRSLHTAVLVTVSTECRYRQRLYCCVNWEIANIGSWVSVLSVVTGLKVVKGGALVLFHAEARGFSLPETIQREYGAHIAYYLVVVGHKSAEE